MNFETRLKDYRGLIINQVKQFSSIRTLDREDLIAEGYAALWKAHVKFRDNSGITFGNFARRVIYQRLCTIYVQETKQRALGVPIVENEEGERIVDEIPTYDHDEREDRDRSASVHIALASLPIRDRMILRARFMGTDSDASLRVLSKQFGITHEGVRQIEKKALAKMRKKLRNKADV